MKTIKWEDLNFKHHRLVPKNEFGVECYIEFKNGEWFFNWWRRRFLW